MLENPNSEAKLSDVCSDNTPRVVYHYTFEQNVDKIIEFGFDKHLNGQGSVKRLRDDNLPKIKLDKYVKLIESLPENKVINTCIDPAKSWCGTHLVRITLKSDIKLLDARSIEELAKVKWSKQLSYARQRGYDGIIDGDTVLLFNNKKIESIEKMS